ncbi:hypothetical protein OIU77_020190 [Salix suchowensis]|uniref:Uncharacterized protein n=1 Tax=Salix suchowensis TaxID=1278906 RepID=A0ABQ9CME5_9ROSI|nr:hypothetical protein OIU77_020190 [Salix suchowensis]
MGYLISQSHCQARGKKIQF